MTTQAHDKAIKRSLQGWSVGAPYPFIVLAINNPPGMLKGLYWYVADSRKGSLEFKDRVGSTRKGKLAKLYATCHARALYAHHIQGAAIHEAKEAYADYWCAMQGLQRVTK